MYFCTEDIRKRFDVILNEVNNIKKCMISDVALSHLEKIEIASNIEDEYWDKEKPKQIENDDDDIDGCLYGVDFVLY